MQEQPTGRQENGHPVVPFLAHCAAQVGPVQVIASIDALLRCNDDLEDDEEVDEEAKLRGCGVDQGLKGNLNVGWSFGWVGMSQYGQACLCTRK